jgi:hypothetical protein
MEDKTSVKSDFYVTKIYSSSTFSNNDLELARKYVCKVMEKAYDTRIVLR